MKGCLNSLYLYYIEIKKTIKKIIFGNDSYMDDYKDEEELDGLLTETINHPYDETDKVIFY